MLRVAVLVSGGGTNLQAIIDAVKDGTITNTELVAVISNNANAYALTRAKENGIDSAFLRRTMQTEQIFIRRCLKRSMS